MLLAIRSRLTYANIVATVALLLALGGSSYAALQITGKNVKDGSLTGRDIRNSSLTARDIKRASLTGRSVKDSTLTGRDIRAGSLSAADFAPGQLPPGPVGPPGPGFSVRSMPLSGAVGSSGRADSLTLERGHYLVVANTTLAAASMPSYNDPAITVVATIDARHDLFQPVVWFACSVTSANDVTECRVYYAYGSPHSFTEPAAVGYESHTGRFVSFSGGELLAIKLPS